MKKLIILVVLLALSACSEREGLAPVVDIHTKAKVNHHNYSVKKGDTLYSIAWRYGFDYKVLAKFNHFRAPFPLSVGDLIKLPNYKETQKVAKKIDAENKKFRKKEIKPIKVASKKDTTIKKASNAWLKPVNGRVVKRFALAKDNKGIEISGRLGETVRAAREGVVAYSGNGLRGYGNLIIIKHNSTFLSAYAMNQKNLVREGQKIKAGAKIAEMGSNNKGQALLHFEIRRNGKPVDPLRFIQPK